jgi:DNA invertase Pin-like site-specific DNA recombinase
LESLDKYGVALECVDQPIDTKTAMGRLFIQITGAFAEWEREITRERIMDGIARARHQGIKCGRPRLPDNAVSKEALRMREYRKRKRFEGRLQTGGSEVDIETPPENGQNKPGVSCGGARGE